MHFILILLFVINGVITLETKTFNNQQECQLYGGKRVQELSKDVNYEGGIVAGCYASKLQEINKIDHSGAIFSPKGEF